MRRTKKRGIRERIVLKRILGYSLNITLVILACFMPSGFSKFAYGETLEMVDAILDEDDWKNTATDSNASIATDSDADTATISNAIENRESRSNASDLLIAKFDLRNEMSNNHVEFPKEVTYGISLFKKDSHITFENIILTSNVNDAMKLKQIKFSKLKEENVYCDMYIDGELYAKKINMTEGPVFKFDGTQSHELKIMLDDTIFPRGDMRTWIADITYNVDVSGTTINLNNYMDLQYIYAGEEYQPDYTYAIPMRKLYASNNAEQSIYSPGEDVVFELSRINLSKFYGDTPYVYLWLNDTISLDNYYLKKIEFEWKNRPYILDKQYTPILYLKSNDNNALEESQIQFVDDVFVWENSESIVDIAKFEVNKFVIRPTEAPANLELVDDFEFADYIGGCNFREFKITAIYGEKPDSPAIITDTLFENILEVRASYSLNPNILLSQIVNGETTIRPKTEPEEPEPKPEEPTAPEESTAPGSKPEESTAPEPKPEDPTVPESKPEKPTSPETRPSHSGSGSNGTSNTTTSPTEKETTELIEKPVESSPDSTSGQVVPNNPGFQQYPQQNGDIVQGDDGIFYYINSDGIPLAYYDSQADCWISIEPGSIALANLPITGEQNLSWLWVSIMWISTIGFSIAFERKRRKIIK